MRALFVVLVLLVLIGGLLLTRYQAAQAAEAQREAELLRSAALEARLAAGAPEGGDSSLEELRTENAELKREIEELRLLLAELEASVAGK